MSLLKTDAVLSFENKNRLNFSYDRYLDILTFSEFTIIKQQITNIEISILSIENRFKEIMNYILYLEEWVYKYEVFKEEYYPKMKVDFDIIAKLEEAKQKEIIEDLEEIEKQASRYIPQSVKNNVWNRDKGQCVECGSKEFLEYDHIVPFSKGGANTERNLQLLCEKCNRKKSAKIG